MGEDIRLPFDHALRPIPGARPSDMPASGLSADIRSRKGKSGVLDGVFATLFATRPAYDQSRSSSKSLVLLVSPSGFEPETY